MSKRAIEEDEPPTRKRRCMWCRLDLISIRQRQAEIQAVFDKTELQRQLAALQASIDRGQPYASDADASSSTLPFAETQALPETEWSNLPDQCTSCGGSNARYGSIHSDDVDAMFCETCHDAECLRTKPTPCIKFCESCIDARLCSGCNGVCNHCYTIAQAEQHEATLAEQQAEGNEEMRAELNEERRAKLAERLAERRAEKRALLDQFQAQAEASAAVAKSEQPPAMVGAQQTASVADAVQPSASQAQHTNDFWEQVGQEHAEASKTR